MKNRFQGRDYSEPLAAALALLSHRRRGDTLTHRELEEVTGLGYSTREYRYLVRLLLVRFREESGIVLFSERCDGSGYKLLTVEEQLTLAPKRRQKRASRQLFRCRRELEVLPGDDLTDHQRTLRLLQMQHMSNARNAIQRQMREQQSQRKIDQLPIPARVLDALKKSEEKTDNP